MGCKPAIAEVETGEPPRIRHCEPFRPKCWRRDGNPQGLFVPRGVCRQSAGLWSTEEPERNLIFGNRPVSVLGTPGWRIPAATIRFKRINSINEMGIAELLTFRWASPGAGDQAWHRPNETQDQRPLPERGDATVAPANASIASLQRRLPGRRETDDGKIPNSSPENMP